MWLHLRVLLNPHLALSSQRGAGKAEESLAQGLQRQEIPAASPPAWQRWNCCSRRDKGSSRKRAPLLGQEQRKPGCREGSEPGGCSTRPSSQDAPGLLGMFAGIQGFRDSGSAGMGSVSSVPLPAGLVGHCNKALGAFLPLDIGNQPCKGHRPVP